MKQSDRATARLDNAIDGLAALYENGSLLAATDPATLLIMATVEIRLSRTKVVPAPDLRSGFLPPLPSEIVPEPEEPPCSTCGGSKRVPCGFRSVTGSACGWRCPPGGNSNDCTIPCPDCGAKGEGR